MAAMPAKAKIMRGFGRLDIVRLMIGRNEQIPDWPARMPGMSAPILEPRNLSTALGTTVALRNDLVIMSGRRQANNHPLKN